MEKTLYEFNSSQDIINLQTKYSFFQRVANIVFSTTVEGGFDKEIMHQAIDKLIERNDCLRITFVKKDKKVLQYFEDERHIGDIKSYKFDTNAALDKFVKKFRFKKNNLFKGETLKVAYVEDAVGNQIIFFKVSHFVADTYAIGLLVSDLFAIYDALKNGGEMPAPMGKFEDVLKKDLEYKNNAEATQKDREFFEELYTKIYKEHPVYTGLHGDKSDIWLKTKRKGLFAEQYMLVKCDTEGYRFTIPAAVVEKVQKWCEENQFTVSAFFYYVFTLASSIINNKEKNVAPLELLTGRGTLAERKCGGTKVQSICIYTICDYEKSFLENLKECYAEQQQIYRHTRLTFLEVEALQHKFWNYSMLSQMYPFSYSYIPFAAPKGVTFQVHSNGKGALVAYIALMANAQTKEIDVMYDIQWRMISPVQLVDFQNLCVRVAETVVANPDKPLGELF